MTCDRDPEVSELTSQIRNVVREAYVLSRKLDTTVSDLLDFTSNRDRRKPRLTAYKGQERRRD